MCFQLGVVISYNNLQLVYSSEVLERKAACALKDHERSRTDILFSGCSYRYFSFFALKYNLYLSYPRVIELENEDDDE